VRILRLRLRHFRNILQEEIFFSAGTNLLYGRNGQGKTNLLEAIYLLGYGKSFRSGSVREMIRHHESECLVAGTIEHGGIERDLAVVLTPGEKRQMIYGKPVALDEFVGSLHVLAFTHEHLKVVRGAPKERRSFIDRAMVGLYPGHLRRLVVYGRTLRHRNSLMARAAGGGGRVEAALFDSWDDRIVAAGVPIVRDRRRFIREMMTRIPAGLFSSEDLRIKYISTVGNETEEDPELEESYRQRLAESRTRDLEAGYTSVGPHRDELRIFLGGRNVVDFGSAGQQRSALLSLYFAQMELHRLHNGHYPVFLIDDVEAELDLGRLEILLDFLGDRTQTFVTSAKETFLPPLKGEVLSLEMRQGWALSPRGGERTPRGDGDPS